MLNGFKSSLPKKHLKGAREYIYASGSPYGTHGLKHYFFNPAVKTFALITTFCAAGQTLTAPAAERMQDFIVHIISEYTLPLAAFAIILRTPSKRVIDKSGYEGDPAETFAQSERYKELSKLTACVIPTIFIGCVAFSHIKLGSPNRAVFQALEDISLAIGILYSEVSSMSFYAHRKLKKREWNMTSPPRVTSRQEDEVEAEDKAGMQAFMPVKSGSTCKLG
jgi:hypothetical protein